MNENNIIISSISKAPSCYTDFIKFLFYLYLNETTDEANKIIESPQELIEMFVPQIIGHYIIEFNEYNNFNYVETYQSLF